jgi:hypothetical protein
MKFYLMVVLGDVEPEIRGPFATAEGRDADAVTHRRGDPSMRDGLYMLDVDANGKPTIGAYSGGFFDESAETPETEN